jgi:hypothetical protein
LPRRTGGAAAWRDSLTFFYDLDEAPITFDFACFLAYADAERQRLGLTYLDVVFVPGRKDGVRAELYDYESAVGVEARRWRLHNICIPIAALLPSCRGYSLLATRAQAAAEYALRGDAVFPKGYEPAFPMPPHGRDMMRLAAQGQELKVLTTPPQGMAYVRQWLDAHARGRKLVTITLREYAFMPERNSNFAAWSAFARALDPAVYCIVIVPDTDQAMLPSRPEFAEFLEFREACWNVLLRSALYESAWLNLGSSGGPMAICWHNPKVRYVMFKILVPGVPQAAAEFLVDRGYRIGAQPPYIGRHQKWVWEPDDLDIIAREFHDMERAMTDA